MAEILTKWMMEMVMLLTHGDDDDSSLFPPHIQTPTQSIWNHFIRLRPDTESICTHLRDEVSRPVRVLTQMSQRPCFRTTEQEKATRDAKPNATVNASWQRNQTTTGDVLERPLLSDAN